jgi:peptide/nickel transport system substrate-binding protein
MKNLMIATALVGVLAGTAQARDLTVAAGNMSSYLDPGRDHSNVGSQFYFNSFDPLIHKDYSKAEQVFLPGSGYRMEAAVAHDDGTEAAQGVKFHNGATMTADDVVFSLNRMFQATFPALPGAPARPAGNFEKRRAGG